MTDPIDAMSLVVWQQSPDPVEKFGVWYIRRGRYWKFNPVSASYVTANDAERVALDAERYAKDLTVSTAIPVDNTIPQNTEGDEIFSIKLTPLSWDNLKWQK